MSRRWLTLLLALLGCGRERPDPRLAEVSSPLHVTVRVIDAPVARVCAGTTWEQLTCAVSRAEREGCVYVEVGEAADTPTQSKQPDARRCQAMSAQRAVLQAAPARKAALFVEPGGERVVVDLPDSMHALYVRGGQLAIQRKLWDAEPTRPAALLFPDGTLNWALVPPFLGVMTERELASLTEPELDALLARTPGGKAALKDSLLSLTHTAQTLGATWDVARAKLDAADRAELRQAMLDALAGGSEDELDWFLHRPAEQGPDFIEALAEAVGSDFATTPGGLLALLKLAPKRAEAIACQQLEQRWHENTGTEAYDSLPPDAEPLAVIVSLRARCPWVLPLLERNPCAWELRCDPDLDDGKETPLCTAAQSARALAHVLTPPEDPDDEEEEAMSDWGPLLLAAALLQGPLPPALERGNARRLYRRHYTFDGDEEDDVCRELTEEPPDWACRLPGGITTSTYEGCRLVLDDEKKTMTLTPTEQP